MDERAVMIRVAGELYYKYKRHVEALRCAMLLKECDAGRILEIFKSCRDT